MEKRTIGGTAISICPVALGCWPLAGMVGSAVSETDAVTTIQAALDLGVNHLDTAFGYGLDGESEKLIGMAIRDRRDQAVIATKGGIRTLADGSKLIDAHPGTLRHECETSLSRLGTDHVELYYLHAPDPKVPIAESAGVLNKLIVEGKILAAGASNCDIEQLNEFAVACPLHAVQPPFNMLQRGIQRDLVPWCGRNGVAVITYWSLLKGLLAGKLPRDHVFGLRDRRNRYPMFRGEEWQKNQDLVDVLRVVAQDAGKTVAQVVVNWTIHQPGITAALCGAKSVEQIRETAMSVGWSLSLEHCQRIDQALADRGKAVVETPV